MLGREDRGRAGAGGERSDLLLVSVWGLDRQCRAAARPLPAAVPGASAGSRRAPLRPAELRPGAGPTRLLRLSRPRGCGERSGRGKRGPPAPSPPGGCCRGLINGSSRSPSASLPDLAGANPPPHPCLILQEPPVPGCGCSAVAPPLEAQELHAAHGHAWMSRMGLTAPRNRRTPAEGTLPPWAVREATGGKLGVAGPPRGSAAAASRRHLAAAGPCRYRGGTGAGGGTGGGTGAEPGGSGRSHVVLLVFRGRSVQGPLRAG